MLSDYGIPFLRWLHRKVWDFELYLDAWIDTLDVR